MQTPAPRFVQIATSDLGVYALDAQGDVWMLGKDLETLTPSGWFLIPHVALDMPKVE